MNVVLGLLLIAGLVAGSVMLGWALADARHDRRQVFTAPALWPAAIHTVFDLAQLDAIDGPDRDLGDHALEQVTHDARTHQYTLTYADGTHTVLDAQLHRLHRIRTGRWRRSLRPGHTAHSVTRAPRRQLP